MDMQKYIENRLDNQIEWYGCKANAAQKSYKRYQTVEIILAALIPLFSGYTELKFVPFIIGTFGALIAIIEALTKLNKHHENWIQYRCTSEMLKHQKNLYLTKSSPYNEADETVDNVFIRNVEAIISSENNQWKNVNSKQKGK